MMKRDVLCRFTLLQFRWNLEGCLWAVAVLLTLAEHFQFQMGQAGAAFKGYAVVFIYGSS